VFNEFEARCSRPDVSTRAEAARSAADAEALSPQRERCGEVEAGPPERAVRARVAELAAELAVGVAHADVVARTVGVEDAALSSAGAALIHTERGQAAGADEQTELGGAAAARVDRITDLLAPTEAVAVAEHRLVAELDEAEVAVALRAVVAGAAAAVTVSGPEGSTDETKGTVLGTRASVALVRATAWHARPGAADRPTGLVARAPTLRRDRAGLERTSLDAASVGVAAVSDVAVRVVGLVRAAASAGLAARHRTVERVVAAERRGDPLTEAVEALVSAVADVVVVARDRCRGAGSALGQPDAPGVFAALARAARHAAGAAVSIARARIDALTTTGELPSRAHAAGHPSHGERERGRQGPHPRTVPATAPTTTLHHHTGMLGEPLRTVKSAEGSRPDGGSTRAAGSKEDLRGSEGSLVLLLVLA
jgi:hypothetical protein